MLVAVLATATTVGWSEAAPAHHAASWRAPVEKSKSKGRMRDHLRPSMPEAPCQGSGQHRPPCGGRDDQLGWSTACCLHCNVPSAAAKLQARSPGAPH